MARSTLFTVAASKLERAEQELRQLDTYLDDDARSGVRNEWSRTATIAFTIHGIYSGMEDVMSDLARDIDDHVPPIRPCSTSASTEIWQSSRPSGTSSLLIIDDDARLSAMVSDYLAAAGFISSGAAHPEARRAARRRGSLGGPACRRASKERGYDEVALLGRTFNQAVTRLVSLLTSQKALLANASQELRSPLVENCALAV